MLGLEKGLILFPLRKMMIDSIGFILWVLIVHFGIHLESRKTSHDY